MRTSIGAISFILFAASAPLQAEDAVVFKDGFLIRGRVDKEGVPQQFDKVFALNSPFTYLSSGPRFVIFSAHALKGAKVVKNIPVEKQLDFRRPGPTQLKPLKDLLRSQDVTISEFNDDGSRTLDLKYERFPPERIRQVNTILTPQLIRLDAYGWMWREVYDPKELGPVVVRKLLGSHPDLRDGWPGVVEPSRRILIARFQKEVGWHKEAREELDRLKKDAPWSWKKEDLEAYDKLAAEIDAAETKWVIAELEKTVQAGQYKLAASVLAAYKPKQPEAKDLGKLGELKATVDTALANAAKAKEQLRLLLDKLSGRELVNAHVALGGGLVADVPKPKAIDDQLAALIAGGEAVYAEVHPDTLGRIKLFLEVTERDPAKKLAIAVSGWLRGENGAVPDVAIAARMWKTRAMIAEYLKTRVANDRAGILKKYLSTADKIDPEEIAQIVTLMPPVDPRDEANPPGEPVDKKDAGASDVYKVETGALPEDEDGLTYYVRLPREYHPGRSYPVILALNTPSFGAEKMIGLIGAEADRNGHIVASPVWSNFKGKTFDYTGKDHRLISSCLRDLARKFQIDPDRVFAFGYGHGANFALDLSMSRPHLFAGCVCMGAEPVHQFYREYWRNAQKCAVYCVTGELSGNSVENLRQIYANWMQYGFYAILSVYKGRALDWYSSEVPIIFDWMNRKERARGVASLRLDKGRFEPWQTFRDTDDRFYWIGATELSKGNKFVKPERPDIPPLPATFSADVRNNTVYVNNVQGVKEITIWLERGMIDWSKDVAASVDTSLKGMKKQTLKPDLGLMLEELYRTGDRKMLFFGKLEFKTGG